MKRFLSPGLLLSFICAANTPGGNWDEVVVTITEVAGTVYMVEGRGGNIGVSIGDDGIIMIDDQFAPLTEKIVTAVQSISDKPIDFVVNTHLHPDHTGGNENLGSMGVQIVAHDLVRDRLESRTVNRQTGEIGRGMPDSALPILTYRDRLTFHYNGEEIRVIKVPAAHTDGDSIVHFTGSNVIHMGDIYRTTTYPYVDVNHGGTFQGTLDALQFAINQADDETVIIPGHGMLTNKEEMMAWRKMLITIRSRIQESVDTGEKLEEALARDPSMEFNERWGADSGIVTTKGFLTMIYKELGGE